MKIKTDLTGNGNRLRPCTTKKEFQLPSIEICETPRQRMLATEMGLIMAIGVGILIVNLVKKVEKPFREHFVSVEL